MAMVAHVAARFINKIQVCFSLPMLPVNSILAGCMRSVPYTRRFYYILKEVHRRYLPFSVEPRVDNLGQRVQGTRRQDLDKTIGAAGFSIVKLVSRGAKVSSKFVFLFSGKGISRDIQQCLAQGGIDLKMGGFGVDAGVATKRTHSTAKAKLAKGLAGAGIIKVLVKINAGAIKFIKIIQEGFACTRHV